MINANIPVDVTHEVRVFTVGLRHLREGLESVYFTGGAYASREVRLEALALSQKVGDFSRLLADPTPAILAQGANLLAEVEAWTGGLYATHGEEDAVWHLQELASSLAVDASEVWGHLDGLPVWWA